MLQLVITYIIIFTAVVYAAYHIYHSFKDVAKGNMCDDACSSCSAKKELKRLVKHQKSS